MRELTDNHYVIINACACIHIDLALRRLTAVDIGIEQHHAAGVHLV